jgi:hypothetical protein
MNPIRCAARGSAAVIGLSDRADGLGEDGVVMRQMAHQNFGVKIYRTDGVCTLADPQRWREECESLCRLIRWISVEIVGIITC